ncbi:twin-arginine translocation signal domain-containing protein [Jatrophihabitans sp. DSM 45814]
MSDATRRNFLIATGAGAAAAGIVASVPALAGSKSGKSAKTGSPGQPEALTTPSDAAPLVAHISDPSTGEVSVLSGDREVIVRDHDLVARLTRAAQGDSDHASRAGKEV